MIRSKLFFCRWSGVTCRVQGSCTSYLRLTIQHRTLCPSPHLMSCVETVWRGAARNASIQDGGGPLWAERLCLAFSLGQLCAGALRTVSHVKMAAAATHSVSCEDGGGGCAQCVGPAERLQLPGHYARPAGTAAPFWLIKPPLPRRFRRACIYIQPARRSQGLSEEPVSTYNRHCPFFNK